MSKGVAVQYVISDTFQLAKHYDRKISLGNKLPSVTLVHNSLPSCAVSPVSRPIAAFTVLHTSHPCQSDGPQFD